MKNVEKKQKGIKILVSDNRKILSCIKRKLETENIHNVLLSESKSEALEVAKDFNPDIVIMEHISSCEKLNDIFSRTDSIAKNEEVYIYVLTDF